MNKLLLALTILLTSNLYSFSQTIIPLAGFQGQIIGAPTESNDTITALLLINDYSNNFTGLDLSNTMNIVLWKNCQRYEVTELVSVFANEVTIKLYKGGNNTLHRGVCALLEENESLISHLISGITDSDKQCIDSYYRNIVSSGGNQLTEAEVDAYADNNGYLEVEVDGSITNEIQDISLSGTDLSISSGSTIDLSSIDTDTNTQLTEAQVDAFANNNGYLLTEVDGSVTNELQTISKTGSTVTLSDGGGSFTDTDTNTQLTEAQVDAFADNNGYLEVEIDGSTTNEIQDISLSGSDLSISSGSTIDLSSIDTDTNTQLTEAQVDAYADNNGYLESEVDGSTTNELQTLTDAGATFTLSNGGGTVTKTVDTNTQLTEAQVDAFADNNGYNEVIGTDSDINTSGSYVVDQIYMTDGVVTSHSTRQLFQLEAEDDRDLAPEDIAYTEDVKTYFTSKLGLDTGNSQNNDYQDAIVLNTWSDGSGGDANLLSFDKSEKKIYHYQADQAATNWGTPEVLAYVSDIPASGGKFVDGTDTDDAVYTTGNVGIGTTSPDKLLVVSGNDAQVVINDTHTTDTPRIRFRESGATSGSIYTDAGEVIFDSGTTEKMRIDTDGNVGIGTDDPDALLHVKSTGNGEIEIERNAGAKINIQAQSARGVIGTDTNHELDLKTNATTRVRILTNGNVGVGNTNPQARLHIDGKQILTNTNGTDGASLFLGRGGNVSQAAEINFVENSSASYEYGFRFRLDGVGNKLYLESNNGSSGTPSYFDLMAFNRAGGVEVENSLSVNGTYSGEYPKDSGLSNVVFGSGNASSMTTGQYSIISGANNVRDATTLTYSNISGVNNVDDATSVNYVFANGAYNNQFNLGSSNYNFFNGYLNARDAQTINYSFFNGRENAEDATGASYSFFSGFQNLHASADATSYNLFNGRENAANAVDADYSFLTGFRNVYTGAANLDYSFITGLENAYNAASAMNTTNIMGIRNAYTTTGNLSNFTAIGYENGKLPTVALNNTILLGYRQGYSAGSKGAASNRLAIGMTQDDPLIYGEFDNKIVEIDAHLTVENGIQIEIGDEDEGRILYSSDGNGDAVWGQADNVGRITTTLGLWSDERQVLLAGTAYASYSAITFPPSGWTTSQQHDGDILTLINRSGSTRELTGDIESTTSTTVDILDDDTIRLVYYAGGDYWIVLSNN